MKTIILILGLFLIVRPITLHDSSEIIKSIYDKGGRTSDWKPESTKVVYTHVDLS